MLSQKFWVLSTYAFLDNVCTDTLISQSLANELNMKGVTEEIQINTITSSYQVGSQHVYFTVRSLDGDKNNRGQRWLRIFKSLTRFGRRLKLLTFKEDIQFPASLDVPSISILIGSNVPSVHVQLEVRSSEDDKNGFYGYSLGCMLCGPSTLIQGTCGYIVKRRSHGLLCSQNWGCSRAKTLEIVNCDEL